MKRALMLVFAITILGGCAHVMTPDEVRVELERRERVWRESLLRRYDLDALQAFIRQTIVETKSLGGLDLGTPKLSAQWSIGGHSMVCGEWYFSAEPETDEFVLRTTFVREKRSVNLICVREERDRFRISKIEIEIPSATLVPITRREPNKAPEPTPGAVTPRASARVAPAPVVAHL